MNLVQRFATTAALTTVTATVAIGSSSLPAQAAFLFGTDGIRFDRDTIMEFTFAGSNGGFQSSLGIFLVGGGVVDQTSRVDLFTETKQADQSFTLDDQWTGTCGNSFSAVLGPCTRTFTFRAGNVYTLGLTNLEPKARSGEAPGFNVDYVNTPQSDLSANPGIVEQTTTIYSTSSFNGGIQHAVFGSFGAGIDVTPFDPTGFTLGNPFAGTVPVSFEDGGFSIAFEDEDFNDFRITAKVVPTPPLMGGLFLLGALLRRRLRHQE